MSEWARRDGEPMIWYSRFERYRLMGSTRSLLGTYKGEAGRKKGKIEPPIKAPSSWDKAASEWNWKQRAEAWDLAEIARVDAQEQEARDAERKEWQQRRRQMAQAAFGKVAEALKGVETRGQSLRQVVGSMATVLSELRAEFDELPAMRHHVTGKDGKPIEANVNHKHDIDPALIAAAIAVIEGAEGDSGHSDTQEDSEE